MTTATLTRTRLEPAEAADLLVLLREQYQLWGCRMARYDYQDWLSVQLQHPWGRRHFRNFVLKDNKQVAAGCKLYTITLQARGHLYKVGGVGAVFTVPSLRGRGHASRLLELVDELAVAEDYDALLLFSDVDSSFYERLGYELLSAHEFYIFANEPTIERQIMSDQSFFDDLHGHETDTAVLDLQDVGHMVRHHQRYLTSLPYGVRRDEAYWHFKLLREMLLQAKSGEPRPPIEFMSIELGSTGGGYAVFEQCGKIMRVLEVVGHTETREILWRDLLRAALLRRVHLIRGWEAVAPVGIQGLKFIERDNALPMFKALKPELRSLLSVVPCPLLELDHF